MKRDASRGHPRQAEIFRLLRLFRSEAETTDWGTRNGEMKIRGIIILVAVSLSFAPQFVNTSSAASGKYSAHLISPTAGQVLYPGEKVRVEWRSVPPPINLAGCEAEVWLSLDGGRTFPMVITPIMDPKAQYFYWTVPNFPTNTAVLDIRFGCDGWYPENYAPQPASMFTISVNNVPSL